MDSLLQSFQALESALVFLLWECKSTTLMDERATAVKPDTITTEASAVAGKVSLAPEEEWPVK